MTAVLAVSDLRVTFATVEGPVHALDGLSLDVEAGSVLGIVGESGAGKSVLVDAALGLLAGGGAALGGGVPVGAEVRVGGTLRLEGEDLLRIGAGQLRGLRGNRIAAIGPDPLRALDPFTRIGRQVADAIRAHRPVSDAAARDRAIDLLELVGLPQPHRAVDLRPPGLDLEGSAQRVMIAIALANQPKLLLADDPTAGLDVLAQAEILALLDRLRHRLGLAIVILSRDIRVVAALADELAILYGGRIVEQAPPGQIYAAPRHRYTWALLRAVPRLGRPRDEQLHVVDGRPGRLDLRVTAP